MTANPGFQITHLFNLKKNLPTTANFKTFSVIEMYSQKHVYSDSTS